jgi:hypothetical protein
MILHWQLSLVAGSSLSWHLRRRNRWLFDQDVMYMRSSQATNLDQESLPMLDVLDNYTVQTALAPLALAASASLLEYIVERFKGKPPRGKPYRSWSKFEEDLRPPPPEFVSLDQIIGSTMSELDVVEGISPSFISMTGLHCALAAFTLDFASKLALNSRKPQEYIYLQIFLFIAILACLQQDRSLFLGNRIERALWSSMAIGGGVMTLYLAFRL